MRAQTPTAERRPDDARRARSRVRLLAFVGKELVETIRRPGALLSLILGPFLILAVFGVGYSGMRRPLETVVVAPRIGQLPSDVGTYQRSRRSACTPTRRSDRAAAEAPLRSGDSTS